MTPLDAPLDAALGYAERGLPVFPLNPRGKEPHGLLAPNGFKNATTDPATIKAWWGECPDANVAIAIPEHLMVIDVDPRNGGDKTWAELAQGRTVDTMTSVSGRGDGGFHLWLLRPEGALKSKLGDGVDVKAGGKGYIVAPPSIHPDSGEPYVWEYPWDRNPATPADWVVEMVVRPAPAPPSLAATPAASQAAEGRPGDDFTAATNWDELLLADGWKPLAKVGNEYRWTRPGKTTGVGCTINHTGTDRMKVFTSSVPGLEQDQTYDRFGYWTATRHGGDHAAAARDLAAQGYGTQHQPIDLSWIEDAGRTVDLTNDVEDEEPEEWPAVIPLGTQKRELPTFPVDVLPDWFADMVNDVAEDLQVPIDLPATLGIAALSAATAGRVKVAWDDWLTATNLYLVIAMPPGAGKSPVFTAMVGPLEDYEVDLAEAAAADISQANSRMRKAKAALKRAEDKGDEVEMALRLAEVQSIQVPVSPRITIEDTTPEALVRILGEQQGRIALMSTEGGLFEVMTGRYGEKRSNLEPYLQAWSGDTIKVDRMGRDTIIVRKPYLSIGITVQPQALMALAERPELAGRGLTSRFMYSLPDSNVGKRDMRRRKRRADRTVRSGYGARLVELYKLLARYESPGTLVLDDPAADLFGDWRQSIEDRRGEGGDLEYLAEWTTKLEASVLRLAGILHLAHGRAHSGDLEADVVADAIAVGNYWIEHAFAVHDLWGTDPVLRDARDILDWITDAGIERLTQREVYATSRFRRRFPKAELVEPPLKLLAERGWIRGEIGTGQRGNSKVLEVNPRVAELRAMRAQPEQPVDNPICKTAGQSVAVRAMRAMPLVRNHVSYTHVEETLTSGNQNEGGRAHGAHGAHLDPPGEQESEPEPYTAIDPTNPPSDPLSELF